MRADTFAPAKRILAQMYNLPNVHLLPRLRRANASFNNVVQLRTVIDRPVCCDACGYNRPITRLHTDLRPSLHSRKSRLEIVFASIMGTIRSPGKRFAHKSDRVGSLPAAEKRKHTPDRKVPAVIGRSLPPAWHHGIESQVIAESS